MDNQEPEKACKFLQGAPVRAILSTRIQHLSTTLLYEKHHLPLPLAGLMSMEKVETLLPMIIETK
ncbi:hypothetical protein OB236_17130 [Paenibacillus sp. WQ 127069]|uniref:Uncharacterized protein n=1 Tax=Paenibacillus baimaensis TaxID=2982185 RepID=A0ABT2UIY1_9BACL|nr:hypothetical protein [Paenibacillus sp. WQ 127069]MCU6793827.1 hypothetical protein [Paenibacillus sp. WQ 127069]